jgi:hypothetical protein
LVMDTGRDVGADDGLERYAEKLKAGGRKKPAVELRFDVVHAVNCGSVGEEGSELESEGSRSARRQVCEQYAPPDVCRSQAMQ